MRSDRRRVLTHLLGGAVAAALPSFLPFAQASTDGPELITLHLLPGAFAGDHPMPTALAAWANWAGASSLSMQAPDVSPGENIDAVGWLGSSAAGLSFGNGRAYAVRLRLAVKLPAGLWRADAALVPGAPGSDGSTGNALPEHSPPSLWRMEGVLLAEDGLTIKTIDVPPHCVLFLRWIETGETTLIARKAVRRALWTTTNQRLQDLVSGALMPVDDIIDALPLLVARRDRAKITRHIHGALLATAKAQALWENGRGLASDEPDEPFAELVTALSEIACAAFGLVPAQNLIPAANGAPARLVVALTNAGPRTVPLVALGVEHTGAGHAASDLSVSHALGPGDNISKSFTIAGDASDIRGIVQFVSDYGAATVPAVPNSPAPSSPASDQ